MKALLNGMHLAFADDGPEDRERRPAVLFLHAFPLNKRMWHAQVAVLAETYRVITLDLRGHGDSEAPLWRYQMADYAEDVRALLDHLGIAQTILVGLSMGGYVCFAVYRQYPDRVRALVLADTRAGSDTPEGKAGRFEMAQQAYREGVKTVEEAMLPRLLSPTALRTRPELVEEVRGMIRSTPLSGIVGDLMAMTDREDARPLLPLIRCPALVLVGEQDQATPPVEAQAMAAAIPGACLRVIPEAGHLANLEQPGAFNEALREFLESVR